MIITSPGLFHPSMLGVLAAMIFLLPFHASAALSADGDLLKIAEAVRTYRTGDPAKALPVLQKHAARGNRRAAFALATMYWRGDGVKQDKSKARELFRESADQGSLYGALVMTSICGPDFAPNAESPCSRNWIDRAVTIDQERYFRPRSVRDRLAMPNPPILPNSLVGRWLARNGASSVSWKATYLLALLHETGYSPNIDVDAKQSIQLMLDAANKGSPMAMTYVGELLIYGHRIVEEKDRGAEWYTSAYENGFTPAAARLGALILSGEVQKVSNSKQGIELLHRAADSGVSLADYFLGFSYMAGRGVARDSDKAAVWLERASRSKFVSAQGLLGLMYFDGVGVERNFATAFAYLQKAARADISRAQIALAEIHASGVGGELDLVKALVWIHFSLAGDQGELSGELRARASELKRKIQEAMSSLERESANELISDRKHGLSFVRARTTWCVRVDGTLCAY